MYRAFEDVEHLQRERSPTEKEEEEEESAFKPFPVENGSDQEEENRTNGTGDGVFRIPEASQRCSE